MPLEFHNNAIVLSGVLGTKLKSKIINKYYNLWWWITSGGPNVNFKYPTSIVEMNAATGEVYIKETSETILGSAGCALNLKFNNIHIKNPNLTLILVENDNNCIENLKKVIKRRFPKAKINDEPSCIDEDINQCVIIRKDVNEAIDTVNDLEIGGRTIYFFDPLLSIDMDPLRKVYEKRIESPFFSGVEFLIFFFTSDWIYGRNGFTPLPKISDFENWSDNEKITVESLNNVLGADGWYNEILTDEEPSIRIKKLINIYQEQLFNLFRFVIPMPFAPKENQIYHLIFCTNYYAGANIFTNFYSTATNNEWKPDNRTYYNKFKVLHRGDIIFPRGNRRPSEWKILWQLIKNYRFGKFDTHCRDLKEKEPYISKLHKSMKWLISKAYIKKYRNSNEKFNTLPRYELIWPTITKNLGLEKPPSLEPIQNKHFGTNI